MKKNTLTVWALVALCLAIACTSCTNINEQRRHFENELFGQFPSAERHEDGVIAVILNDSAVLNYSPARPDHEYDLMSIHCSSHADAQKAFNQVKEEDGDAIIEPGEGEWIVSYDAFILPWAIVDESKLTLASK